MSRSRRWLKGALLVGAVLLVGVLALGAYGRRHGLAAPRLGASRQAAAGTTEGELRSGGETRHYRLHVPPSYAQGTPVPLVVDFHGFGANAREEEALSGMSVKADEAGFIVVYPEGKGRPQAWRVGPGRAGDGDVQFIRDLVAQLRSQYEIDPARVYASGISNGGGMVHRLGCDAADVFAAIGPVAGAYLFADDCSPARPVPVVAFHGTADPLAPYGGNRALPAVRDWAAAWAARDGCSVEPTATFRNGNVTGETWSGCRDGADVVLYTIDGGGHSWPGTSVPLPRTTRDVNATDVIWQFFLDHPQR